MPSQAKAAARLRHAELEGLAQTGAYIRVAEEGNYPAWATRGFAGVARALAAGDPELVQEVEAFLRRYGPAIQDLSFCPMVNRLVGRRAFGIKGDPRLFVDVVVGFREAVRVVSSSYPHDRWVHSQYVAAHGLILALRLHFSQRECVHVVFAGLLHDLGHPAFGHDIDQLLIARGRLSHEERGLRWVSEDPDIAESLTLADLTPADVLPAMAEKGPLGTLQKLADTLGYLVLDTEVLGIPLGFGYARRLIDALWDIEEQHLITRAPELFREFLDIRAVMYRDVYYRSSHNIAAAFLCKVMEHLIDTEILSLTALEEDAEQFLETWLAPYFNGRADVPLWIHSAWLVAHAMQAELKHWRWQRQESVTDAEAARTRLPTTEVPSMVCIAPIDYTGKTLHVRLPHGDPQTLRASSELRSEFCRQWHTFSYDG